MANKGDHEDNGNDDENDDIEKTDLLTRAEKVGLRSGE